MLPTPHGPTDAPLPVVAVDATVGPGRTPDEGALLRVVEHLADVPDGEVDDEPPSTASSDGTAPETPDDVDAPAEAGDDVDAPAEAGDDVDAPADRAGDDVSTTDDVVDTPEDGPAEGDAPAAPAPDEPTPPVAAAEHEVGPVAAALSDTRHRIDDLNPAEQLFLGQQRSLVTELCADPSDAAAVGALFDRVHEQWRQAEDRPDLQPLADAFGVALGDLVRAEAPHLDWATCSDRFGTEIVLARRDPEVLVYPIAAVAQSWTSAGPGWFVQHLTTVLQGVAAGAPPSPDTEP